MRRLAGRSSVLNVGTIERAAEVFRMLSELIMGARAVASSFVVNPGRYEAVL